MVLYGSNKRGTGRIKREFSISVRRNNEQKQVYTIDLSVGGAKVGGVLLKLAVGETVELVIQKDGGSSTFPGQVARADGMQRINRIGRDVSAYFVRVTDDRYADFVKKNFGV